MCAATKPKKTLAEIRLIRSEAGKKSGATRRANGVRTPKKIRALEKEIVRHQLEQRFMRVTERTATAQISLAVGQQFLYKIEKKRIEGPKGGVRYENQKPVLVTAQWEIENYLEELADNNGELSDDQDPGATYYYLTTKEPNNEALKDIHNRTFGKPIETVDLNTHHTFSLTDLAASRVALDGNADLIILPNSDAALPALPDDSI